MKQILQFAFIGATSLMLFGCVTKVERQTASNPPETAPAMSETEFAEPQRPIDLTLFNGNDLSGWQETDFGGRGEIVVENGAIKIYMGSELTGINWTNAAALPKTNYEIELEAMKLDGNDFFCGLTFPANKSFCSLILGGWGGGIVGISSIDNMDASENDTSRSLYFERNRWYHIRVQVTPEKLVAWIDKDKVIDVEIVGRKVATRPGEIDRSIPLGVATWQTSAAIKNFRLKSI